MRLKPMMEAEGEEKVFYRFGDCNVKMFDAIQEWDEKKMNSNKIEFWRCHFHSHLKTTKDEIFSQKIWNTIEMTCTNEIRNQIRFIQVGNKERNKIEMKTQKKPRKTTGTSTLHNYIQSIRPLRKGEKEKQ